VTAGATRRLFFALWPDAATRAAIEARRDALGALSKRVVPAANFHVTLVFLGDQPAERLASIEDDAERIRPRCRGFALRMDRFGWFARARVAWLGGQPPAPGAALAGELHRGLSALGLAPEAGAATSRSAGLGRDLIRPGRIGPRSPLSGFENLASRMTPCIGPNGLRNPDESG